MLSLANENVAKKEFVQSFNRQFVCISNTNSNWTLCVATCLDIEFLLYPVLNVGLPTIFLVFWTKLCSLVLSSTIFNSENRLIDCCKSKRCHLFHWAPQRHVYNVLKSLVITLLQITLCLTVKKFWKSIGNGEGMGKHIYRLYCLC